VLEDKPSQVPHKQIKKLEASHRAPNREMMRFCILGSGSSGNSALLQTAGATILIDAGLSARRLDQLLADHAALSLDKIDAIFLTHEHGDHCAGLDGLRKHPHIRLYANAPTARAIQAKLKHRPHWVHFETGARFAYRDLEVTSFSVPHDAQEPVGFRFECAGQVAVTLTDLGYAPPNVRAQLAEADILVVEANHCAELLKADPKRPWSLKQRISGRHGHLSNAATAELLAATANPRWRQLFLVHLSRDCNTPEAVATALAEVRPHLAPHCEITILPPGEASPLLDLSASITTTPHTETPPALAQKVELEPEVFRSISAPFALSYS